MNDVTKDDVEFLNAFFSSEELSDERLKELDERLKNPNFKIYYQERLNKQFETTPLKLLIAYIPMILLVSLTIIGIYLILK